MSRGVLLLSGSAVAAALGMALVIGWTAPGRPTPPLSVTRYPRLPTATALHRPNEDMADAVDALRDDLGRDPGAGGDRAFHPRHDWPHHATPAPTVDEAQIFRRQVAAVVNLDGQGLAVLLANPPGDPQGPRLLKVGDLFDDQWRIAALSMDEVVLQDGAAQMRVPLFGGADGVGGAVQ